MNTLHGIYRGVDGFAFTVELHDQVELESLGDVFGGVSATIYDRNGKVAVRCECDDIDDIHDAVAIAEEIIKSLKKHHVSGVIVEQPENKRAEPGAERGR